MATISNNTIDIRGCPAVSRFTVPTADIWVAVLLHHAHEAGATRVAINIAGGGKLAHAAQAGGAASGDYHALPDGQSYWFELDPNDRCPGLYLAVDTNSSAVSIHVTSGPR